MIAIAVRGHGGPHQETPQQLVLNSLSESGSRVIEEGDEYAGGQHEQAELPGLHQVFRPVAPQCLPHGPFHAG
jgi:hypothetical protein